jgi:hypothetical protein
MKTKTTALLALLCATATAQSPVRDALINQIEDAIGRPAPIAADSPVVTRVLTAAKNANPQVDPVIWESVRVATAAACTKKQDSYFDSPVRGALQSFTDGELKDLSRALNDPLAVRFRDAFRKQPKANMNLMSNVLELTVQINGILAQHQLKQVLN